MKLVFAAFAIVVSFVPHLIADAIVSSVQAHAGSYSQVDVSRALLTCDTRRSIAPVMSHFRKVLCPLASCDGRSEYLLLCC
jgi:hypothetical protein